MANEETNGMSLNRWKELMDDESKELTSDEQQKGWHFCTEWDGLLIHPSDEESRSCKCFDEKQKQE